MTFFELGDSVRVTAIFTDSAGTLADPTTVKFDYLNAAIGTATTYTYPTVIVKASTGTYYVSIDTAESAGLYDWRFYATGTGQTADTGRFYVRPNPTAVTVSPAPAGITFPLSVANGGTGNSTFTLNGSLYGNGSSAILATAQGAANSVLTANAGAPAFSATPRITRLGVGAAVDANNYITVPLNVSYGISIGSTIIRNQSANFLEVSGETTQGEVAIALTPPLITSSTGTVAEFIVRKTNAQAFGGTYSRIALGQVALGGDIYTINQEVGGTEAVLPLTFLIGAESTPSVFTVYEPMRIMGAGTFLGSVNFGTNGLTTANPTPYSAITLIAPSIGAIGVRSSNSILFRGKANDGSEHAVDWLTVASTTTTAGLSTFLLQNRVDSGAFVTKLALTDTGALQITSLGVGVVPTIAVNDLAGASRSCLVSVVDAGTTIGGSLAAVVIVNSSATTSNTAQLNFAANTGASNVAFTSAIIAGIFGPRTNAQYPTGQLAFLTTTTLNFAPSEKMRLDNTGNLGIGVTSFGTGAAGVLALSNAGTAPQGTSPPDIVQIFCQDISAGNAVLSIVQESAPSSITVGSATTNIPIRVNGTTYYILAKTAP